jgi:hypothetical protein
MPIHGLMTLRRHVFLVPTPYSYPTTIVSTYPIGLSTPMKYPVPQYKPSVATTTFPHYVFLVNYEGYTTTPSRHGNNLARTTNNLACYVMLLCHSIKTTHFISLVNR